MSTKRSRKLQIGDFIKFDPNAVVKKFHKHPMDVMHYLEDINNPKLVYTDSENIFPEVEQNYLISDARDYFDRFGYRTRVCKVVGLVDSLDGWMPAASLKLVYEGSEDPQ